MPVLVRVLPLVLGPGPLCCVLVPGSSVLGPACGRGTGSGPGLGPDARPGAGLAYFRLFFSLG